MSLSHLKGFKIVTSEACPEDTVLMIAPKNDKDEKPSVAMITNIGPAIEPDAFWSPSMQKRRAAQGGVAGNVGRTEVDGERGEVFRTDPSHPDVTMMLRGYTRNPATCTHERKRMTDVSMAWRCIDCGEWM